jgi:arsenate reductase
MLQILHNPRCGKSRQCLAMIENSGKPFKIINYLKEPLTRNEIIVILKKLNCEPIELIRKKETIWIEKYHNKTLSVDEIINAMVEYPILIERPIAINKYKAFIARDLDVLSEII